MRAGIRVKGRGMGSSRREGEAGFPRWQKPIKIENTSPHL